VWATLLADEWHRPDQRIWSVPSGADYAREGVDLDRATMADWVGKAAGLLRPLVDAIAAHVMAADKLHADDTPVPVLDPGRGRTRTGRLWVYLRDDRPWAGPAPPAVAQDRTCRP
jgi:transposase